MKYEKLNADAVAEYLRNWNSFWAGEYGLGFGKFETRAFYTARVELTHDEVSFLLPGESRNGEREIRADFHTAGCEAWKTQDDWYNQYVDAERAFPWELENNADFQAVCLSIVEQIRALRPAPPNPPLDVDKHGLRIDDDSIRAVVEKSKKLGWRISSDDLREDTKRTAWLCYNGTGVWLDNRNPREIDAWVRKVGGALTAQEVCDIVSRMMSNPA